jgi:hypothetical protein
MPADITNVCNSRNTVEAVVFPGEGGFWFLDVRSDAPPVGPFPTRERAELSADINVELDREIERILTPKPLASRCLR